VRPAVLLWVPAALPWLGGCFGGGDPEPPPVDRRLNESVATVLEVSGVVTEVANVRIVGKRYLRQSDDWQILACYEIAEKEPAQRSADCNDSFRAYRLDDGRWVVSGNLRGRYRWHIMPLPGADKAKADAVKPPSSS